MMESLNFAWMKVELVELPGHSDGERRLFYLEHDGQIEEVRAKDGREEENRFLGMRAP